MNDPRTLATRLIDEIFTEGNYAAAEELIAPDMLEHHFDAPATRS